MGASDSPVAAGEAWPAPAKLNLMLHITGRRADGYHLLQTVFQILDHGDLLSFSIRDDGVIDRAYALDDVPPERDLILRAARALRVHGGDGLGVTIALDKRLPMGGGLGGGSSDAATVLVALNHLWGVGLDSDALCELGLALGADVPVFVRGQAAWAEGVGEQLRPLELDQPWYLVVDPQVTVSTAEVFSDPELTRNCAPLRISDFLQGRGGNVCEPVVFRRYPAVGDAHRWLDEHGSARLTGTGACVFAPFTRREIADEVLGQLPAGWRGFVAQGRNRSPLLERLAAAEASASD